MWLVSRVTCHMLRATCCVSPVACHLSLVTCHLSPTPTATATDPHPSSFHTKRGMLVCKDKKAQRKIKTCKIVQTFQRKNCFLLLFLQHNSNMLMNQMPPVHQEPGFPGEDWQTNTLSSRLVDWIDPGVDAVKMSTLGLAMSFPHYLRSARGRY